ncbi:hypothetical protein NQ315_004169, partial [Exocentrus adspersus]
MSSPIDPAKLKVVDLRSELSARGLDTKGNKAALVKRLKDALEQELKQDLPDTSIADTSTEDLDISQNEEQPQEDEKNKAQQDIESMEVGEPVSESLNQSTESSKSLEKEDSVEPSTKSVETKEPAEEPKSEMESSTASKDIEESREENGEDSERQIFLGKYEFLMFTIKTSLQVENTSKVPEGDVSDKADNQESAESKEPDSKSDAEQKGEKRRRSSASPERSQRRRSRSPIKEDEPALDNNKVQLSWYDSDLHLQLDKESFLSAKPLTDGAFGYAWAGVRATHGVSSGKVYYEVKITEELKWEDLSKSFEQRGRDRYRTDHRKNQKRDKDKDSERKSGDKPKSENGDVKDAAPAEKEDKSSEKEETPLEEKNEPTNEEKENSEEKEETEDVPGKEETEDAPGKEETEKMDTTPVEPENESKDKEEQTETGEDKVAEGDAIEENKDSNEECMIVEEKTEIEDSKVEASPDPIPTHLFRVGWSLISTGLQLGEEKYSYGYESTGKFVTGNQFVDYGIKFGTGDVIAAFLDIDEENVTITYTVNGEAQPVAATIPRREFPQENFGIFPHVLSRNYAFEFNFGDKEEPWFPIPSELEGYQFLSNIDDKVSGPTRPETRGECEVILMCGLPASGKTHWVKEYTASNLDKRYTVLGNSNLLEKMTVSGEPLKAKFKGRWSLLVDKFQKCLNKLISIAALRRRNYIIDQTNVFPSAQRRKMRPFEGFKRRAVIVVVGDEEQARRQALQEAVDGKEVPDSTILEMKAAMSIPEQGDWLEEVSFVGLEEAEAKETVKKYNAIGKEAGYGDRRFGGRRDDRWQNRRQDYRGGKNFRDRSYHNQRYEPRGPPRSGGWSNQRSSGGNWNRDRRNNRGPPVREWRGKHVADAITDKETVTVMEEVIIEVVLRAAAAAGATVTGPVVAGAVKEAGINKVLAAVDTEAIRIGIVTSGNMVAAVDNPPGNKGMEVVTVIGIITVNMDNKIGAV